MKRRRVVLAVHTIGLLPAHSEYRERVIQELFLTLLPAYFAELHAQGISTDRHLKIVRVRL